MVVNDADIHTFSVLAYTLNFSFREKKLFFVCFFLYKVDNRGSEMPVKRSFHFHCSTKISNEIIARREPDWLFTGCCGSTRDCESALEVKEQQVTV